MKRPKNGVRADLTYLGKDPDGKLAWVTIPLFITRKQFDSLVLKAITEDEMQTARPAQSTGKESE